MGTGEDGKMAEYLASALGSASPKLAPQLNARPSDDVATRLAATIYETPRGVLPGTPGFASVDIDTKYFSWTERNAPRYAEKGTTANRGDHSYTWLHDTAVEPISGYVYYSDQYANILGQINPKTGEVKEFTIPNIRPGKLPGTQQISIDKQGNVWVGVNGQGAIARFNPKLQKITGVWAMGDGALSCGFTTIESSGEPWCSTGGGRNTISRLDLGTGKFTSYTMPKEQNQFAGFYGVAIDSQNRVYSMEFSGGNISRFDRTTGKFTEWKPPTANAGPRRGSVDSQDRLWFAEFFAGNLGMFDPRTEKIREWRMPDHPWPAPYMAAVDTKNNKVWISDFNSDYIFLFDIATEKFTRYLLPEKNVRIRFMTVDQNAIPSTVWIPNFTPPGQVIRLQAW
jgi:streptogramin lyase